MARAPADAPAQSLWLACAALLLGRAAVGGLAPLAVAFAAAALSTRIPLRPIAAPPPPPDAAAAPDLAYDVPVFKRLDTVPRPWPDAMPALAMAAAAAIGAATRADPLAALGQAAGILLAWVLIRYAPPALARGLWAAVLGAIPARIAAAGGLDLGSILLLAVVAVLAGVLQAVFARALDTRRRESVAGERAVAAGILAGALVAGIGTLQLGPISLGAIATAIATLWLAQSGPAAGAAGAVSLGAVAAAAGAIQPLGLAALAVGGLAAGFASPYSRLAAAAGLLAGEAVVTASATFSFGPDLLGLAIGCIIATAIPIAFWPLPPTANGPAPVVQRWVAERLRRMAAAVAEVGRSVAETAPTVPIRDAQAGLRPPSSAVEDVVRAVCTGCSAYVDCWDRKFMRAFRMVDDLLLVAETRPVRRADVGGPGVDTIDCLRPSDMARAINLRADLGIRASRLAARLAEGRDLVAGQMEGLARVLEEMAISANTADPSHTHRRTLRYEKAVTVATRPGRETSGDAFVTRELTDGRLLLALSDGMGSGTRAATQSGTAVTLLERLLNAGFPAETAVQTVNATLLLREPEETYATIDVALLDLVAKGADFFKLGAPWGFHVHDSQPEAIGPDGPPAGALVEVPVHTHHRDLEPGDELVLCTDGVVLAGGQPRWLGEFLEGPAQTAEDRAESILAHALELAGAEHDDMTVVVCRLLAA